MAVRNDISVDWWVSPRIVTVAAPSVELLMQDLVDTLRAEESTLRAMSEPSLLDAFGKQALFGTVAVGITVALQDAQIEFEARTAHAASGTATSGSATQLIDTDTDTDFVAAGVKRGSIVINFSDTSVCDVLEVVDSNTLTVRGLTGGVDNDFDIGDIYRIWNVPNVDALGGNLTAVDANGSAINPLLPTFATQASRALAANATIVDDSRIADIHKIHGLDSDNPMQVNENGRSAGDVTQTFTVDTDGTTVTRT